jgi:predicted transcriptional regulator
MQLSLDYPTPRARNVDPATSHVAAAKAARFSESHAGRIHVALTQGPATAHELAERTGLTVVQIDRRLPELQRMGMAAVVVCDGKTVTRDGFRVWWATQ